MKKETKVVLAMYCCGKTTMAKSDSEYSILDFDSYLLDEVKNRDDLDEKTKKRIEKYNSLPVDSAYLQKIENCIGEYDIILLSTQDRIISYLRKKNIPYLLVYPEDTKECMQEWCRRNKERGTEWLWKDNCLFWHTMLHVFSEDKKASKHIVLKPNEYLSDKLSDIVSK